MFYEIYYFYLFYCDDEVYYYIDVLVCVKLMWYDMMLEVLDCYNGKCFIYNLIDWMIYYYSLRICNVMYLVWFVGVLL